MTRTVAVDRRHAFIVRDKPLPTFRVRSASGEPAHFVVLQPDGSLLCNCIAASFRATCAHVRIAIRSIERRTGVRHVDGRWSGQPRVTTERPLLRILQGGRGADVDAAWEAVG